MHLFTFSYSCILSSHTLMWLFPKNILLRALLQETPDFGSDDDKFSFGMSVPCRVVAFFVMWTFLVSSQGPLRARLPGILTSQS